MLPSVKTGGKEEKGDDAEVEDFQRTQQVLDEEFKATVSRTLAPYKAPKEAKDKKTEDDENKTFR